jgi:hypothetical protein
MGRHTPGPWTWERVEDSDLENEFIIRSTSSKAIGNDGQFLSDDVVVDNDLGICNEGDARLIAEAPELLKMLKHAVRYHDQLSANDIAMMEAVIGKAEGRT